MSQSPCPHMPACLTSKPLPLVPFVTYLVWSWMPPGIGELKNQSLTSSAVCCQHSWRRVNRCWAMVFFAETHNDPFTFRSLRHCFLSGSAHLFSNPGRVQGIKCQSIDEGREEKVTSSEAHREFTEVLSLDRTQAFWVLGIRAR